jgi:hypothetical protein
MSLLPGSFPNHNALSQTSGLSFGALNPPALTSQLDDSPSDSTSTGRLRSTVESGFRRMFEAHDRIRAKLLAVHSTQLDKQPNSR